MQTAQSTNGQHPAPSTTEAAARTELITFTYGERHIAVRRPGSYQYAVGIARRLFDLHDTVQYPMLILSIDVDGIDVDGAQVELGDEVAWSLVQDREWVQIMIPADTPARPDNAAGMAIYVRTLTGKTIPFNVTDATRVAELRMLFQTREGIPPCSQRLVFAGYQLEDNCLLVAYGIRNDSYIDLVLRLSGGKPVILFYYPMPVPSVNVSLALRNCWEFSAVYPFEPIKRSFKGDSISWNVNVDCDGLARVSDPTVRYSSLFWEAETIGSPESRPDDASPLFDPRKVVLDSSNALVFTFEALIPFLEHTLRALQLTDTAATDFMQYWMPNFTKLNERNMDHAISFLPMKHLDEVATLSIQPAPDVVFRVFLLFKGVSKATSAAWVADQKALLSTWLADVPAGFEDASKQRVLEWGGMQVF